MKFLATFGHWINTEEPAMEDVKKEDLENFFFIVEADSLEKAMIEARRYEGLETWVYEGISELKEIVGVDDSMAKHFPNIKIYESYLKKNVKGKHYGQGFEEYIKPKSDDPKFKMIYRNRKVLSLGMRIREFRESKGLSQKELAECTGMNEQEISQLENSEFINNMIMPLIQITEALGYSFVINFSPLENEN